MLHYHARRRMQIYVVLSAMTCAPSKRLIMPEKIVAKCWSCPQVYGRIRDKHYDYHSGDTWLIDLPYVLNLKEARECLELGHDVRPVEAQRG